MSVERKVSTVELASVREKRYLTLGSVRIGKPPTFVPVGVVIPLTLMSATVGIHLILITVDRKNAPKLVPRREVNHLQSV